MQERHGHLVFSATDVAGFLECEHLMWLDFRALSDPALRAKKVEDDESSLLLAEKGIQHEKNYLRFLIAEGKTVVDIAERAKGERQAMTRLTEAAMREAPDVIYQAALAHDDLAGFADFLVKVPGTEVTGVEGSRFGATDIALPTLSPSYEAADTKLARSPKGKFLVQLAFYSQLLEQAQGALPAQMHLVLGDQSCVSYRTLDFIYYFKALLSRYRAQVEKLDASNSPSYPLPCRHCNMCRWREVCEHKRLDDDHLSQVAGISRQQVGKLESARITTMAALAAWPQGKPIPRLNSEISLRLREQAALQHEAKQTGQRRAEVLALDKDGQRGFFRLPAPDPADLFFDMEGDPLQEGGLEYLFGLWFLDGGAWTFKPFWAHDRAQERLAFEAFMDFITEHRRQHPAFHIYHYASYEETALKRLASLHATREVELDNLLRNRVLVDLYRVVRESLRISEPSYSIKYVERFYRDARSADVKNAGASIVYYERWRETADSKLLQDIADYNKDDVESTQQLHQWLLTLRPTHAAWRAVGPTHDGTVSKAVHSAKTEDATGVVNSRVRETEERLVSYRQTLVDSLPGDRTLWNAQQHIQELVYFFLDFHRRADKPQWWALFARRDMDDVDLLEDAECLACLTLDPETPPRSDKQSVVYTYRVPPQETKLASGDLCTRTDTSQSVGTLTYDPDAGRVVLRVAAKRGPLPDRLSIGPGGPLEATTLVNALYRVADSVIAGDGQYTAISALLRRDFPQLAGRTPGQPIIAAGKDVTTEAVSAALALKNSCLYVQGPPGSGKTYTGARMIAALLAAGKRVGIMSNSHKAINHLMAGAMEQVAARGLSIVAVKKSSHSNPDSEFEHPTLHVINCNTNNDVFMAQPDLLGGTAWLFADKALDDKLDVLFVDEAGQVALANLVAAATCARNIVLLGDQMQLSQPTQGVHPGRSGDSALDYLLDGAATISPERGIFLGTTYRMHPDVCRFISDAVYEGRLLPEHGNMNRTLVLGPSAHSLLRPAGAFHVPVEHTGCSQTSQAEADLIALVFASALGQLYTDKDGIQHQIAPENILVMAPYNAQVNLLRRTLPLTARIGTVDKFQGQEAELVLVSMTTSSENDLPRHLEFLYSKNRLNVAVSRAKCLALVLANPRLLAIRCDTPKEISLVNTLCWLATYSSTSPSVASG